MSATQDVLLDVRGVVGRVVLNRPRAINALTHDMIRRIGAALREWERDPRVGVVTIAGAGERGLCAGGDLRGIYDDLRAGGVTSLDLWRDEYRLNATIARYRKPIVAIMDGVVMGGGVGLSAHASQRVVTDRTVLAMPEVAIGLVPDVGGSWLLARAPREFGVHVALSARRLAAGDALAAGLADWYVPADRTTALLDALVAIPAAESDVPATVGAVVQDFAQPAPPPASASAFDWIEHCYRADTVEEVLARLTSSGVAEAGAAAREITRMAPTAVKVAFAALRRARALPSLEAALDQEFRITARCFAAPDIVEGIRAQVIEKDRDPRWTPPALHDVTDDAVNAYFAPLEHELGLAPATRPTG